MAVKVIGTHSGPFHADDVMACAILQLHPDYKTAVIERSRDQAVLDNCHIVVDVGGEFCHEKRRYDHHQKDFYFTMERLSDGKIRSKTKLSSAGLIFYYYGEAVIRDHLGLEKDKDMSKTEWIFKRLYNYLINEIDFIDNGGAPSSYQIIKTGFTQRISRLNPRWDQEDADFDGQFKKALSRATEEFLETLMSIELNHKAKLVLSEKILEMKDDHESGKVVIFQKHISVNPVICEVEKEAEMEGQILFVINPSMTSECFGVNAVFNRIQFPEDWAGLVGEELERVTGVEGAHFVHLNRHLAITETRQAAVELVNIVLQQRESTGAQQRNQMVDSVKEVLRRIHLDDRQRGEKMEMKRTEEVWRPGSGGWRQREQRKIAESGEGFSVERNSEKGRRQRRQGRGETD